MSGRTQGGARGCAWRNVHLVPSTSHPSSSRRRRPRQAASSKRDSGAVQRQGIEPHRAGTEDAGAQARRSVPVTPSDSQLLCRATAVPGESLPAAACGHTNFL